MTPPRGPFAVIIRRTSGGWECLAMFQGRNRPGIARRASWARKRETLMGDVRAVLA